MATPGQRAGWLLRVNRVLGAQCRLRTLASLATALSESAAFARRVSGSTVSRWEAGQIAVSHRVLRGYEEVLELPGQTLTVAVDTVRRYWSAHPDFGDRATDPPIDREVAHLLDRISTDDVLSGADWDHLTTGLLNAPGLYLRSREWTELVDRLLRELLIADRAKYLQRREAFQRLLVHPVGQQAAIAAAVSAGDDVTGQVFGEAISALDGSHPDASRAVLRQLEHPTNRSAHVGALQAAVRKLLQGHFDDGQRRKVYEVAEGLRVGGPSRGLADLVRTLAARPGRADVLTC